MGGEEQGGVEGWETVIRIYYMRKKVSKKKVLIVYPFYKSLSELQIQCPLHLDLRQASISKRIDLKLALCWIFSLASCCPCFHYCLPHSTSQCAPAHKKLSFIPRFWIKGQLLSHSIQGHSLSIHSANIYGALCTT